MDIKQECEYELVLRVRVSGTVTQGDTMSLVDGQYIPGEGNYAHVKTVYALDVDDKIMGPSLVPALDSDNLQQLEEALVEQFEADEESDR